MCNFYPYCVYISTVLFHSQQAKQPIQCVYTFGIVIVYDITAAMLQQLKLSSYENYIN